MFQIVVLPPPQAMLRVEEFRRLHDPAFHRVAAHVVLVPAFDAADAALVERFDGFAGVESFVAEFGPAAAVGRALCLPFIRGDDALRALQSRLCADFLDPLAEPTRAPPCLRVGLFGTDAEIELGRRTFGTLPAPEPLHVDELVLLLEDSRGLWHDVRRRRLRAARTGSDAQGK